MIRIVARPDGEAPEAIRDAWIGLELPLVHPEPINTLGFGVLTGPKYRWLEILLCHLGRAQKVSGYVVPADEAIQRLAAKDPAAAMWWKTNAARYITPGAHLVFDLPACEPVGR
ncbi:MAG: hypothetical protein EON85_15385 [Brevundimonas sp.]|nr:MAG: hypothetical protein EON85_15385 [Brevundimonas sp.]